jgi:hypothetical protein
VVDVEKVVFNNGKGKTIIMGFKSFLQGLTPYPPLFGREGAGGEY